jgi:hypothetical protein
MASLRINNDLGMRKILSARIESISNSAYLEI